MLNLWQRSQLTLTDSEMPVNCLISDAVSGGHRDCYWWSPDLLIPTGWSL